MFGFLMERKVHNEANILLFTSILSFVGLLFAGYLTYDHLYPTQPAFCVEDTWWDCGQVLHGPYNNMFGIPYAILGLLGFVLILLFSIVRLVHWDRNYTGNFFLIALLFALVGAILAWYLTYLELFVIEAICPYCFTCCLLVTIVLGIDLYGFLKGSNE